MESSSVFYGGSYCMTHTKIYKIWIQVYFLSGPYSMRQYKDLHKIWTPHKSKFYGAGPYFIIEYIYGPRVHFLCGPYSNYDTGHVTGIL